MQLTFGAGVRDTRIMKQFVGSLSVAVLLAAGCKSKPLGSPPTVEEAQALVAELAKINVASCDAQRARELFDLHAFAIRLFDGNESLASGAEATLSQEPLLTKAFCLFGAPKFLRVQTFKGEPKLLYRRLADSGVSYLRLDLLKREGKVRVVDWLDFSQGATVSETGRQMMAATINGGHVGDSQQIGAAVVHIGELLSASKHAEAREEIAKLPPAIRAAKNIRVVEVTASNDLPAAEYGKVLDAFAKDFGDDPSMQFMLIDHYFVAERFDDLLAAVAMLRKALGDDAMLYVFEANAYLKRNQAGDLAKADEALQRCFKLEPGFGHGLSVMMDLRVAQNDTGGAAAAIRAFYAATKRQLSRSHLSTVPPAMLQSAEFDVLEQEGALIP